MRHRHEPHVTKGFEELAVLLVGERLDRRGVHHALAALERERDRVLRHHRLARARVCGDQHRLATLDARERLPLERIELEREVERVEAAGGKLEHRVAWLQRRRARR